MQRTELRGKQVNYFKWLQSVCRGAAAQSESSGITGSQRSLNLPSRGSAQRGDCRGTSSSGKAEARGAEEETLLCRLLPPPLLPPQPLPSCLCLSKQVAQDLLLSLGLGRCGSKEPYCSSKLCQPASRKSSGEEGGGGLPKRPSELVAAKERRPF